MRYLGKAVSTIDLSEKGEISSDDDKDGYGEFLTRIQRMVRREVSVLVLQRVREVELYELVNFYLSLYLIMKDITFRFYVVRILLFLCCFWLLEFFISANLLCKAWVCLWLGFVCSLDLLYIQFCFRNASVCGMILLSCVHIYVSMKLFRKALHILYL